MMMMGITSVPTAGRKGVKEAGERDPSLSPVSLRCPAGQPQQRGMNWDLSQSVPWGTVTVTAGRVGTVAGAAGDKWHHLKRGWQEKPRMPLGSCCGTLCAHPLVQEVSPWVPGGRGCPSSAGWPGRRGHPRRGGGQCGQSSQAKAKSLPRWEPTPGAAAHRRGWEGAGDKVAVM